MVNSLYYRVVYNIIILTANDQGLGHSVWLERAKLYKWFHASILDKILPCT